MNRLQFAAYLRHTLIPDFIAADMEASAEDFETSLQFICDDVEIMHDARKALLAASAHTPAGSNASALITASLKEIDEALGRVTPSHEKPQHTPVRRCLEDRPHLKD
jgi:hypothetical protein